AQAFNTQIRKFPTSMFASVLGFEQKEYFQAEQGAEQAPEVDFGN
ncbi:MAG: LemA family protein, partial [Gracilimonas sp.]|nr:LemA family protein [Gracilimonas sp.]